jgi:hypothetical protein
MSSKKSKTHDTKKGVKKSKKALFKKTRWSETGNIVVNQSTCKLPLISFADGLIW